MGTYNNETEPEVLIFDYRDLMYLRLITGSLLTIYESIDFMEPYIDILKNSVIMMIFLNIFFDSHLL